MELLKRALWRPWLAARDTARRRLRERRWLAPRKLAPFLETGGTLVGEPLQRAEGEGRAPLWADFSGAMLVPVHPVGAPERRMLLKIGTEPAFRDRLLVAARGLQGLENREDLPAGIRSLLPRAYGSRQLDSGVIVAVEEHLAGVSLESLVSDPARYDRLMSQGVDLLIALHRATRVDGGADALVIEAEATVGRIESSGLFATESVADLQRFAAQARERLCGVGLPSVLAHGDFHAGNLLVAPDADRLTGLLDFDQLKEPALPFLDLAHLYWNHAALEGAVPFDALAHWLPPGESPPGPAVVRYLDALAISADQAAWLLPLYLLDAVEKRLPGEGPLAAVVRRYEAPLLGLVRDLPGGSEREGSAGDSAL